MVKKDYQVVRVDGTDDNNSDNQYWLDKHHLLANSQA